MRLEPTKGPKGTNHEQARILAISPNHGDTQLNLTLLKSPSTPKSSHRPATVISLCNDSTIAYHTLLVVRSYTLEHSWTSDTSTPPQGLRSQHYFLFRLQNSKRLRHVWCCSLLAAGAARGPLLMRGDKILTPLF